jgi:hypothetical protein
MAVSLVSTGVTFPDSSTQITAATGFGFKNRIINGAMVIDQRNAGASVTATGYTLDRWVAFENTSATSVTAARSTTAPTGFTNSLLYTVGTGGSAGASEQALIRQRIEGYNVSDFSFGTASAATVTLSFQVRSSLVGTYSGALQNSAGDRSYVFSYTISAANTWETKTITVSGDTSGTWLTDNGIGLAVFFDLGSGSNYTGTVNAWSSGDYKRASGQANLIGTSSATFYITGVQLEKGSTATSFDYRPYGTELALCQRYYYKNFPNDNNGAPFGSGFNFSTTLTIYYLKFPVSMRASPTALEQSGTAAHYGIYNVGGYATCTSVPSFNSGDPSGASYIFIATGLTAGQGSIGRSINVAAYLAWSAEL